MLVRTRRNGGGLFKGIQMLPINRRGAEDVGYGKRNEILKVEKCMGGRMEDGGGKGNRKSSNFPAKQILKSIVSKSNVLFMPCMF